MTAPENAEARKAHAALLTPASDGEPLPMVVALKAAQSLSNACSQLNAAGMPLADGISPDGAYKLASRALQTVLLAIMGDSELAERAYDLGLDGESVNYAVTKVNRDAVWDYQISVGDSWRTVAVNLTALDCVTIRERSAEVAEEGTDYRLVLS
jgi:hypothetical protein